MRKFSILISLLVIVSVFWGCKDDNNENIVPPTNDIKDYDGNIYHSVKIGNKVWMVENLKVTHYRNGDPIPNVTDNETWSNQITGAFCDYNNDTGLASTYGKIYNWYTLVDSRHLAPKGWHIASETEWNELISFLGGDSVAGGKLKESGSIHWNSPNAEATNVSGFTALPGGIRLEGGVFMTNRTQGFWWTSTSFSDPFAYFHSMSSDSGSEESGFNPKEIGMSVRCIKD